jgi:ferritin
MNLNLKWSKFMTLFTEVLEDEKKVKKEIRKLQTHKYKFIENRNKNILSNFRLF